MHLQHTERTETFMRQMALLWGEAGIVSGNLLPACPMGAVPFSVARVPRRLLLAGVPSSVLSAGCSSRDLWPLRVRLCSFPGCFSSSVVEGEGSWIQDTRKSDCSFRHW